MKRRNSLSRKPQCETFNRTILELKPVDADGRLTAAASFNRTILELKRDGFEGRILQTFHLQPYHIGIETEETMTFSATLQAFNRTILELKPGSGTGSFAATIPSTVPYWN